MSDALFDLPDDSFIFVHYGFIVPVSQSEYTSDDDGFPIRVGQPDGSDDSDEPVPPEVRTVGYAAPPNPFRDGRTERIDTVFLVPSATAVTADDMVRIPTQPGMFDDLAGLYEINQVRPNPAHTRLLLTRAASPEINTENIRF